MATPSAVPVRHAQRGASLVEVVLAMAMMSLGILAIAQLFPAGSRTQLRDRMLTVGSMYAQQKLERLRPLSWTHADLTLGRHPSGVATEALGGGKWQRWYEVVALPAPLDDLKKVTVMVRWEFNGTRTVTAATYLRR